MKRNAAMKLGYELIGMSQHVTPLTTTIRQRIKPVNCTGPNSKEYTKVYQMRHGNCNIDSSGLFLGRTFTKFGRNLPYILFVFLFYLVMCNLVIVLAGIEAVAIIFSSSSPFLPCGRNIDEGLVLSSIFTWFSRQMYIWTFPWNVSEVFGT